MPKPEYFVFNDENVKNSYGFYINTLGIKMDRFNDNPVMLNNHINSNENVIGNWSDALKENGLLKLKPKFDEETELGKDVSGKVERGFLKGCSMGIIPNWDSVERVGDRLIMMECELAEGSIIPVPSNKGAIAIYSIDGKLLSEKEVENLTLSVSNQLDEKLNLNPEHNMKKITLSVAAFIALGFDAKAYPKEGIEENELDLKIQELAGKVTTLTKEKEALELSAKTIKDAQEAEAKTRITTKVELGITQGKFGADKKDEMIALGLTSESVLDTTLAAIPAKQNFSVGITSPTGNGNVEVKSMDDFEKLSHDAKLSFKETSPEAYKKLFNQ